MLTEEVDLDNRTGTCGIKIGVGATAKERNHRQREATAPGKGHGTRQTVVQGPVPPGDGWEEHKPVTTERTDPGRIDVRRAMEGVGEESEMHSNVREGLGGNMEKAKEVIRREKTPQRTTPGSRIGESRNRDPWVGLRKI